VPVAVDPAAVQRRTLRLLFVLQIVGGVGVAIGASVGALLAADLVGVGVSGLAQSSVVVGAALLALPATAIVQRHGRRPSLAACYGVAMAGSILVVVAAARGSVPLLFAGFLLFGGATAAGFQARYAAVDLAPAERRGRHLSLIVWGTTLGAVTGPHLAAVAGAALDGYGIPTLAGPFAFSALLFGLAAVALLVWLRPDPAIVARIAGGSGSGRPPAAGVRAAIGAVSSRGPARLAVSAMAVGHLVMVGVMAMTPVHIRSAGHDAAHTLRIVGVVLSFHIAGMYALSPLMGWLTDRVGRRPVILAACVLLIAACALAGGAGHDPARLAAGLMVLGLGWSASTVAGATLLSESVAVELRASAQGLSDLVMGLAGACAGALSGVVVHGWGYPTLTLAAALATAPLIVLVSIPPRYAGAGLRRGTLPPAS
jgi:MFS family permease